MAETEFEKDPSENEQEENEENAPENTGPKLDVTTYVWRTALVVGLVGLLLLGILLPIRVVPGVISDIREGVSGFFTANKNLTLDKKLVASGDVFTLDLSKGRVATGTDSAFVFTYPCRDGVYFEYSATGIAADSETISCDTPFIFTSTTKKITLRAVSLTQTSVEQPITINLTTIDPETASSTKTNLGTVTLTIKNPNATSTPPFTPPETSTSTPNPYPPATTTPPSNTIRPIPTDLSVNNLQVGTLVNGQFIATPTVRSMDTVVIRFVISNQGGRSASGWTFDISIPTIDPNYSTYHSPLQTAMNQNSGVINSLSVNNLRPGFQTITVTVDQNRTIADTDRSNNQLSVSVSVIQ